MLAIKRELVLFLLFFRVSDCHRKIMNGHEVTTDKRYVVYLVRAPISAKKYDTWLCGGALVSRDFIVTSAACVEDVEFMYAIAGYKKYVTDENLETDPCTKDKKKKVVYTCTPVSYNLKYDRLDNWAYVDIALVRVESPYDFDDGSYQIQCSYIPSTIPINYEIRYQEPGTDAMVLGWGHTSNWRTPDDDKNYNQPLLRYASTMVENKEECKREYEVYPNMSKVIDEYMICTMAAGNINDAGETILKSEPTAEGCTTRQQKLMGLADKSCEEGERDEDMMMDNTRRERAEINQTYSNSSIIRSPVNVTKFTNITKLQSRRNGICQNDHGGPLVTWVGSHEVLIGIASVFKVADDNKCIGPFLYTSTQCNGAFLDCVLTSKDIVDPVGPKNRRNSDAWRSLCDSPPSEKGYDTVEKHISWMYHPSGPADNERKSASLKNPPGMQDRYSQDHYGYGSGMPDRYSQDHNKYGSGMPDRYSQDHNKYGSGMPDRYSQDQEDKYDNGGNDRYKKYERHEPERFGADHHGMDKNGVEKRAPVKYGNTYGADKYEGQKYEEERHGPPNYDHASSRGRPAERHKTNQFAGHDRYRSEPNPEIEQPPEEKKGPKELFVMRPQRPLHS